MKQSENKPRRALVLRSRQEINNLLTKYEGSKKTTSLVKFCRDHGVPTATFYTWQKNLRQGKHPGKGKFIELPVEPVPALRKEDSTPVFASLSSGGLTIQLHQYVDPAYIKALLGKQKGL